jgi:transcription-repair coupling factor (superfamily II helicase)
VDLALVLNAVRAREAYKQALSAARSGSIAVGALRAARPMLAAALAQDLGRPTLIVTARPDRASALASEFTAWWPQAALHVLGEPAPMAYEIASWDQRVIRERATALAALADPTGTPVVITSARALLLSTLPRAVFTARTTTLTRGGRLSLDHLLGRWVSAGYEPTTVVLEPGQFARRGGIADIWPVTAPKPVRIELFGDEVDTLRPFEPGTQRAIGQVETVTVTPAREGLMPDGRTDGRIDRRTDEQTDGGASVGRSALPAEFQLPLNFGPASMLEYLTETAAVIVDDWVEFDDVVADLLEHAEEQRQLQHEAGLIPVDWPSPYMPASALRAGLAARLRVHLASDRAEDDTRSPLGRLFSPAPRFGGQVRGLFEALTDGRLRGQAQLIVARQAARLANLWSAASGYPAQAVDRLDAPLVAGQIAFVTGGLSEGWALQAEGGRPETEDGRRQTALEGPKAEDGGRTTDGAGRGTDEGPEPVSRPPSSVVYSDAEVFGVARILRSRRRANRRGAPESNYAEFKHGDLIVHEDYGVGRFRELGQRVIDGLEREYLVLEFAEGDELYVPVYQADRLSRYVGASDTPPALSRLGSSEWTNARGKAQAAAEQVARELLELYAKRELASGHAFSHDSVWQAELEGAFPFVETEDQNRAIHDVKADMERPRPMDRLICGDVGFGKTEVALRAAFKAVMSGTQVAILVPTTVLAQQHYHTFKQRFAPYPVKVEMLSRFRTARESRTVLHRLAEGQVDVVIGTHKLLGRDVRFRNLGLLIVDEEQRFGVTHKERIKALRASVDVLTLTATPIPRTLYMALAGLRDISTITTPPEERLPIITHVGPYNERLVRQAIVRELERDGQIFYLHNRVQSIGIVRDRLARLAPEARIGVAHGQMEEHELSAVMDSFSGGNLDLLVCTSIIESGLDIPNANTLIVDRADTFGLAQLYQLRGRVGRSTQQAYAYFFTASDYRPTPEARERLDTLAEQTELGAGYAIAMRDLEMRGAGDIIGPKQSGQITAVGFHLYTKLLGQAVRRLRGPGPVDGGSRPAEDGAAPSTATTALELGATATVDLPLALAIPDTYVADGALRAQLYQRMAAITRASEIDTFTQELAERFGPPPKPVENLLYQLRVKLAAIRAGIPSVSSEGGMIVFSLHPAEPDVLARQAYDLLGAERLFKRRAYLRRMPEAQWKPRVLEALHRLSRER